MVSRTDRTLSGTAALVGRTVGKLVGVVAFLVGVVALWVGIDVPLIGVVVFRVVSSTQWSEFPSRTSEDRILPFDVPVPKIGVVDMRFRVGVNLVAIVVAQIGVRVALIEVAERRVRVVGRLVGAAVAGFRACVDRIGVIAPRVGVIVPGIGVVVTRTRTGVTRIRGVEERRAASGWLSRVVVASQAVRGPTDGVIRRQIGARCPRSAVVGNSAGGTGAASAIADRP